MPHATVPSPGLQALILCGPGSSLSTFTSNPKDLPKAIIPIANRPMVWYPLDWCYRMGVNDITLIIPPESSAALETALATNPSLTSLPSPKPEILAPSDLTQTTGTGELLRLPEVQKTITSDFILLPCDLISELDGTRILQHWMTLNPLSTTTTPNRQQSSINGGSKLKGGMTVFYPTHNHEGISTKHDETDFLATTSLSPAPCVPPPVGSLRQHIENVVLSMPTDTLNDKIEADKGFLRLRQSLLRKHGKVKFRTKYRDAHVYVFPRWVKDFVAVAGDEVLESVSEDVVGWWGKAGWQAGLAEKLGLDEVPSGGKGGKDGGGGGGGGGANGDVNMEDEEVEEIDLVSLSSTKISSKPATQQTQTAPAFASRVGVSASPPPKRTVVVPPLLAYVQPTPTESNPQPLVRRIDTSNQLLTVSLYLAKQTPEHVLALEHKIHPTAKLEQQSRVSLEDCLIGENVKLGFRSNVKESVIGANCEIGKMARLTRCLLMDGVTIGDGVVLSGCIVGRRARIEGFKSAEAAVVESLGTESGGGARGKKGKAKMGEGEGEDEKTKLTDCEVAPGFVVEAGMEAKGEKFMGFDTEGFEGEEEEEAGEGDNDGGAD